MAALLLEVLPRLRKAWSARAPSADELHEEQERLRVCDASGACARR